MMLRMDLRFASRRTSRAYRQHDWRKQPIAECDEPLVELPSDLTRPYYALEMGLTEDTRAYLRTGVLERLDRARQELKCQGFDLVVLDGWRSIDLQEVLYWHYMRTFTIPRYHLSARLNGATDTASIKAAFDQMPEPVRDELHQANRQYVSWPTASPKRPSPHATGGAVDVWPYRDGQPQSLGVEFDEMRESAGAFYHLRWGRERFADDAAVIDRRQRLLRAMLHAGFSVYPPEIWHYNFGNQMDAIVKGEPARYSYVEP